MEEKKRNYKKIRIDEMEIIGRPNAVKVVHSEITPAIKLWKRNLRQSGVLELVKLKTEFTKPSALKRAQKNQAIQREIRNRKFE